MALGWILDGVRHAQRLRIELSVSPCLSMVV